MKENLPRADTEILKKVSERRMSMWYFAYFEHFGIVRGPFRLFVLFSNESNQTEKKQCDSERKRMRRERADIERDRMQAYREMPVTPPHQRKMCVRTHEAERQRRKKVRYKEKSDNNNEAKKAR